MGLAGHVVAQRLHQAGLADARLAAEQHHVPEAVTAAFPAALEELAFLVTPDQRLEAGGDGDFPAAPRLALLENPMQMERRSALLVGTLTEVLAEEIALGQPMRGLADRDGIGCGQPLDLGRDVGRLAQGELLAARTGAHLAHHDGAGVDADTDRDAQGVAGLQRGVQRADRLHDPEPGAHGALRIVLVRLRVAVVDEEAVAEVLRDVSLEALDHLGTARLVGAHHLAEVLGVETARERRRPDEIAEEHRELAALLACRRRRLSHRRRRGRVRRPPDEQLPLLIHGQPLGVDDLVLERLEDRVVELKADLQRAIGYASVAAEQIDDACEEVVKLHRGRHSPRQGTRSQGARPTVGPLRRAPGRSTMAARLGSSRRNASTR